MIIDANFKEVDHALNAEFGVVMTVGKGSNSSLVCNALKGSASGNPIRIDDTSPLEHEIAVGVRSKNLFDIAKVSDNTVINTGNGEEATNPMFATSDYIAVPPNTTFVGSHIQFCTYYDKDKKYVSDIGDKSSTIERVLTTPANTHYVRFGYQKSVTDGSNVQLEIGSTASAYTPFVEVNGATVKKYGKNLCNPYDFTLGQDWNGNQNPSLAVLNMPCLPNTSYAISWNEEAKNKVKFIIEKISTTATTSNNIFSVSTNTDKSFTTKPNTNCICVLVQDSDFNYLITYDFVESLKIQIEKGTTATEYEPYKEPITYTADENGKVNGIIGNGEDMTLTADSGVIIDAKYNRDINKAFAQLLALVGGA